MARNHVDWLQAYIDYASISEAPKYMHFWSGVSAIAGALQRKVWFNMGRFNWYPNFYIIIVAPPGIVTKSTTTGIAMKILKQVPGVKFGPDIVTWPSLVEYFANSRVAFDHEGMTHEMCCLTLHSTEFGNLLDTKDKKMVDLFVKLWDSEQGEMIKATKGSGTDTIINPWINKIACTTPSWIADNFPEYMIGGGYTSRCVFVYAEDKDQLMAYPFLHMQSRELEKLKEEKLLEDLIEMSKMTGEFILTPEAIAWGVKWYEGHWKRKPLGLDKARFGGYISRKQSHLHKLGMILSASCSNNMLIEKTHLETANLMVTELEKDMIKVFSKIGKSDTSFHVDRLLEFVKERREVEYKEVYKYVHANFPSAREFEDVLSGCIKSRQIELVNRNGVPFLIWIGS